MQAHPRQYNELSHNRLLTMTLANENLLSYKSENKVTQMLRGINPQQTKKWSNLQYCSLIK